MSWKEKLKEEGQKEKAKLKNMSWQDRVWYIWEYYKFHIGAVLVLILLISVVITSVRNASIDPGLYCVIINNRSSQELDTAPLEQDFFKLNNREFQEKLKEFVGHTPLQVLAGAVLGIIIALLVNMAY